MVIVEWNWNHANLHGPRPLAGFCAISPPTQIIIFSRMVYTVAGDYHSRTQPQWTFIVLRLFAIHSIEEPLCK